MGLLSLSISLLLLLASASAKSTPEIDGGFSKKEEAAPFIAFSAVNNVQVDYLPGNTIIFDEIITNEGGLYANNTGQFVCSNSSVYFINVGMSSQAREDLPNMRVMASVNLALNEVKSGPKTNAHRSDIASRSTVAEMSSLVECTTSPPSTITVRIQGSGQVVLFSNRSSFSGFNLGAPDSVVGFMAELSEETYKFPGDHIRFDNVLRNYGGAYNVDLGMFQCPDNATYVFSVSAQTVDHRTPWSASRIMMDGDEILVGPITYNATEEQDSGSASITAVTRCQQGRLVFVESFQAHDFPVNSYAPKLSSFMGFRLYPDAAEEAAAVAFLAVQDVNVTNPQNILMRRVLTNIGNAYDAPTGAFICPDDKFYMFSFTAVTSADANNAIIMDNAPNPAILLRRNRNNASDEGDTSGSATASVIVKCNPNNRVRPRHINSSTNVTYYQATSSFSGYKLPGQL